MTALPMPPTINGHHDAPPLALATPHSQLAPPCASATSPGCSGRAATTASSELAQAETNTCNTCGTLVACADVSFDLRPGHTLGIVGESGSGKTTVLRCLYGDLAPTHGTALLAGYRDGQRSIFEASSAERRIRNFTLGMVYQHAWEGLNLRIDAGGNVAERLLAAEWRRIGQIRERAATLLGRMEVPITRMDDFGPLQRRHAAARPDRQGARQRPGRGAAGRDDEWPGRLGPGRRPRPGPGDPARRGRGDGRRLHDLGVVRLLCERTIVMKNGRVVEAGLTDQILEDPHHPYTQLLVSSINA